MKGKCNQPNCFFADVGCKLGNSDLKRCPHWKSEGTSSSEQTSATEEQRHGVPWSGLALGRADLVDVIMRGRSSLLGILGPTGSGKTSFLVGLYLMMMQGRLLADSRFCGSLTFDAWESLADWMRWIEIGRPPTFPPHTSSLSERQPGLLHLGLRTPAGRRHDVLLTDAPGEWFTRWALKADTPDAEGARWIAERCDAFLVLADCERLAGSELGSARRDLRLLMERLSTVIRDRPVALVWTKRDIEIKPMVREAIKTAQEQYLGQAQIHETTTSQLETFLQTASAILGPLITPSNRPHSQTWMTPIMDHRPFLALRRQP